MQSAGHAVAVKLLIFLKPILFITLIIILGKNNRNRHIKHEILLDIYGNMDYFRIIWVIVAC